MTPDDLRAAIAADCPHRLVDIDAHLAAYQARVEAHINRLYRRAQKTRYRWRARRLIAKASRIRHKIKEGLK